MSDLYPIGQPIRLSTTVRNSSGALADPTGLSVTITAPDNTTSTLTYPATITKDTTGTYHADVTTGISAAGRYRYVWTATGSNAGVDFDVFDVFDPATYPRLVSFADAKEFLRLSGTSDDARLDRMIGWASARILREYWATPGTVTERVQIDPVGFVLSTTPVRAVTAITAVVPNSAAIAYTDAVVTNPYGGTVEFATTSTSGIYDVTYTVGANEVPPGVVGACETLLRHWWSQSQAHGSATYGDSGFVPDFKGLPNVVLNMLASVPNIPGIG